MLKAKVILERAIDGQPRPVFLMGLAERNFELLRHGKELVFDGEAMGIPGSVCIFYGRDEKALVEFVQRLPDKTALGSDEHPVYGRKLVESSQAKLQTIAEYMRNLGTATGDWSVASPVLEIIDGDF